MNYNYNFYNQPQTLFSYVNSFEEANNHLLTMPGTIYLKDRNSEAIYEKTLDYQGRYTMKVYKPIAQPEPQIVSREEFLELQNKVNEILNKGNNYEQSAS